MIKIFPFYKGENLANNPLGYTTKANARKRMKSGKVRRDFDKTLPTDYWFDYLYTYENGDRIVQRNLWYRTDIEIKDYNIRKRVYVKDIKNQEVVGLLMQLDSKLDKLIRTRSNNIGNLKEIALRISELGYYPHCWKDDKDYWKKYSKFVTANVEFKEMDVDLKISDATVTEETNEQP